MPRTALVTGATGLLGRQVIIAFQRAGYDVVGTGFSRAKPPSMLKLDLNSSSSIASVLDETKPDVVVHCAANRFPDKCDSDPDGTRALNITASQTLAQLCAQRSIFLLYISTDYVFPGVEGEAPYEVDAVPRPTNLYGETKWEGEKAVLGEGNGGAVVLRVPVLYGSVEEEVGNKESAVNVLMDAVWKVQKEEMKMDHWAVRYPTNTEDVGRVCTDTATKYLDSDNRSSLPPILHFSSEDKMTKYEICELLAEIMGLPIDNMSPNTDGNDPNAKVQRPYDCHLSTKALKDMGINISTMDFKGWWRREVRAFRK
ncbi:putative methionine adenosyltransferase 2 subunit beta [Mollisia scopiformis]|uniref:Putative methionine adenosyltransferase 2 subunit beta n=1 Tax=Mollisia scopiformis TaxID=149040 RepID=A0A194XC51_MOLSC|nr:putative methionine adenosyltransferase 2 subunit beta [Mollisia scopiformis]KUJ17736.1 putative methionine adenosyltransferase 2 subunit beta [Mollisia scopiformis]